MKRDGERDGAVVESETILSAIYVSFDRNLASKDN